MQTTEFFLARPHVEASLRDGLIRTSVAVWKYNKDVGGGVEKYNLGGGGDVEDYNLDVSGNVEDDNLGVGGDVEKFANVNIELLKVFLILNQSYYRSIGLQLVLNHH